MKQLLIAEKAFEIFKVWHHRQLKAPSTDFVLVNKDEAAKDFSKIENFPS